MQASAEQDIVTCSSCGSLIDVSEQDPFTLINCPNCGTRMRVQQRFAHYEIHDILGEGGQGMVYRALDTKLNRPVAIKVMKREYSADPNFVSRFGTEARITANLNHPNIVKVYSFGEHRGLLYIAMEMVDHGSLESLMAQAKKVPVDRALDVAIQIAGGLKAGLALGLIHRDIKPGNILFADERTAKIVDFGLAILVKKQHEESGDVWATPYYVAPEKLDGQAEDFRSDMYSLAATVFHAIAGRPPFVSETNSMEALRKIKSRPIRIEGFANRISAETAFVINKALNADPEKRFQTYDDFIHNLEYARDQLKKGHVPRRGAAFPGAGNPKGGGGWITFATVALVLGGGLYWWSTREQTDAGNGGKGAASSGQTEASAEAQFDEAHRQLVDGELDKAAKTFRALYEGKSLPEPKNSWAAVHLGIAEFFAGDGEKGRGTFTALRERLAPTEIGLDAKLVAFLNQLAGIGAGEGTDAPPVMEKIDKSSYEAIAYIVAAAKHWEAGAFDEAVTLLRQFQQATPSPEWEWIAHFRPLATRLLDEIAVYREVADPIAKADAAPAEAEAALKKLPRAKAKIRSSVLLKNLTALEAKFSGQITGSSAAAKAEMEKKKAEMEAAEDKILMDAKLAVKALAENYRFAEAAATIQDVDVKLDSSIEEKKLLAKRIGWLVQFKRQLIQDVNASACVAPIQRKNGQPVGIGVAKATDDQLEVRLQFGSLPVKLSEISPKSILQMAGYYMRVPQQPAALADRQWRAGVFCLFTQLVTEGQSLMDAAAPQNPEYQIHRGLFFGQPAPEEAK